MSYFLRVGDLFEFRGKTYRILDIGAEILVSQRTCDLVPVDFRISSLLGDETFRMVDQQGQEIVSSWDPGFDSLDEETREEVRKEYELIEPCVLLLENVKTLENKYPELLAGLEAGAMNISTLLKRRAQHLRQNGCLVSERKLWRLWKKWKYGGFKGLVEQQGAGVFERSDNKSIRIIDPKTGEILQAIPCRLSDDQVRIVEDVFQNHYLKPIKPIKARTFDKIKINCRNLGVEPVARSTVYRLLSSIEDRYQVMFRDGKKEYNKKYRQVQARLNEAQGPLHVVQIDHTLLDLDVVDDERTGVIGRPWITVGLDEYSRMPWCLEIGWENPSVKVLAKAIYQGVFAKNMKEIYGTENELEVFGIPNIIFCDNGKEFHSKELQRIVEHELKSELRYRPPKTPNYGGIVERFFHTLNTQLIHGMYGTRKSKPGDLGDRDPEKEACVTLSELKRLVYKFITDIYPYLEHRGLPKECPLPSAYYRQGLEKWGLPRVVLAAEKENFWLRLLPEARRKICREGIQINNILYSSEQTKALVGHMNQRIKTDPYDVSCIYLLHPIENTWLRLPATKPGAGSLEGVTDYEWKCIQEKRKEKGRKVILSVPQTETVLEIREKMYKEVEEANHKRRKAKRKIAIIKATGRRPKAGDREEIEREQALQRLEEIVKPMEDVKTREHPYFTDYEKVEETNIQKPGFIKW